MFFANDKLRINTPQGFKSFAGVQIVKKRGQVVVSLTNGRTVKCSPNHRLMTTSGWKLAINIAHSDIIVGKGFESKVFFTDYLDGEFEYYDVVGVDTEQFYANDILSHNCEFLGSSNTLISPEVLRRLVFHPPIHQNEFLKVYTEPSQERLYIMSVDVSRGLGGDYSAFIIWDITEAPYKTVAVYKNNNVSPLMFPEVIYSACKRYNYCYVLIETNDLGQQVADILHEELEYENIIYTQKTTKGAVEISQGFKAGAVKGVRTTKATKKVGCNNFKALVENDKVELLDMDLISELYRFVSNGNTYEAEDGNDDLAMCGVLFGWMMTQNFIKEITNLDIRQRILLQQQNALNDELLPFGIIEDGHPEPEELPLTRDLLQQLLFPDEKTKEYMEKVQEYALDKQFYK